MAKVIGPDLKRALAARIRYYNELGIYDFYRHQQTSSGALVDPASQSSPAPASIQPEQREEMSPRKSAVVVPVATEENIFEAVATKPEYGVSDPVKALKIIREDLGDCTRCRLARQGRKQIVFGVGNPKAELMFIGEAPGADEDQQGEPFVGRAGQLLTNMIKAMGLEREQVYIANIIKCRPPNNRTPERDECETCSPFLMRQIATIKPKVVVALGAVAAKTLLAISDSMSNLRGRWYDFRPAGARSNDPSWTSAKLAVTYHPAFLLRDPRQKKEAWKDLQMVMKELGLKPPAMTAE
jgi:uracil-DNA glycosylase family 4